MFMYYISLISYAIFLYFWFLHFNYFINDGSTFSLIIFPLINIYNFLGYVLVAAFVNNIRAYLIIVPIWSLVLFRYSTYSLQVEGSDKYILVAIGSVLAVHFWIFLKRLTIHIGEKYFGTDFHNAFVDVLAVDSKSKDPLILDKIYTCYTIVTAILATAIYFIVPGTPELIAKTIS